MTATITKLEPRGADAPEPAEGGLRLITVNPAELTVHDQARVDATPDDALVASVRAHGILQPPTVTADPEQPGRYMIVTGHRRVGAAIAAGIHDLVVVLRHDADPAVPAHVEQQIVENERRKGLTPAEVAQGYRKLELFGKTPEDIAAELGEQPDRVRAGLKAARSEKTLAILGDVTGAALDLEQAAVVAEFDDDPIAQQHLLEKAGSETAFNAEARYRRKVAHARNRVAKVRQQLVADEVPVVGELSYEGYYWAGDHSKGRRLSELGIAPEEHLDCPGHAALLEGVAEADTVVVTYVCTDWQGNEHPSAAERAAAERPEPTEEEIAARKAQEEHWQAEQEERARFTANHDARREWIRGFLAGRLNQTAGIFDFIAEATLSLIVVDDAFEEMFAPHLTLGYLDGDFTRVYHYHAGVDIDLAERIMTGQVTALRALVAAAFATCDHVTRSRGRAETAPRLVLAYFARLAGWGYELTDIDMEVRDSAVAELARRTEDD